MKTRILIQCICVVGLLLLLCPFQPGAARAQGDEPDQITIATWPPRPEAVLSDPETSLMQSVAEVCPWPNYTINNGRYTRAVFMSYRDVKWEIYIQDACSSTAVSRLTNNSAFDGYPRLDSTLSRIVFVSDRDGQDEIYSMDLSGKDVKRLTANPAVDTHPAWSPDRQQIVFVSDRSGDPDLYLMNRDGANVRLLAHLDGSDVDPSWSPDGKQIVWVHWNSSTTGQIYVINADGSSAPVSVTAELAAVARPAWSPDGKFLAFGANPNNDSRGDLAWIDLSDRSFHWRMCVSGGYTPCNFRMGSSWPENNMVLGTQVTYSVNGTTAYLASSSLYQMQINEVGHSYGTPLSRLDFAPDAVSIDANAPTSRVLPLPEFSPSDAFNVSVLANDVGAAGLDSLAVEYSSSLSPTWWQSWGTASLPGNPATVEKIFNPGTGNFSGTPGTTLYFRSQAQDVAGHLEAVHTTPEVSTRLYSWSAIANVVDQRDVPLSAVSATVTPSAMNQPVTDSSGVAKIYLQDAGTFSTTFARSGYVSTPAHILSSSLGQNLNFLSVLPSGKNILSNGQFEDATGALNGWQSTGSIAASVVPGHTGTNSARLGTSCSTSICFAPVETITAGYFSSNHVVATPDGEVHVIYAPWNSSTLNYTYRSVGGQWSSPIVLTENLYYWYTFSELVVDSAGNLAFIYMPKTGPLQVAFKPHNLPWTFQQTSVQASQFVTHFDTQGRLHVLISDKMNRLYYFMRKTDGAWTIPLLVYEQSAASNFDLIPAPDGTVHIVYFKSVPQYGVKADTIGYIQIRPNGELTAPEWVNSGVNGSDGNSLYLFLAPDGVLHLVINSVPFIYLTRSADGVWSSPWVPLQNLIYDYYAYTFYTTVMDNSGNLHILLKETNQDKPGLRWMVRRAGQPYFETYHVDNISTFTVLSLASSPSGNLHLVTAPGYWDGGAYYRTLNLSNMATEARLNQTVTIPADMYKPTLSFMYRLDQFLFNGQTAFNVLLKTESGVSTNLLALHNFNDWQHAWADLSPWKGQTVTLTFQLYQAAGAELARFSMDEVTLSAWTTPTVRSIGYIEKDAFRTGMNWRSEQVAVSVLGENFNENARILLAGKEITPTWISETELSFNLPTDLFPGRYLLTVVNPGGAQAVSPIGLDVGQSFYLPLLQR